MDPNLFTSWHAFFIMALPGIIALLCKPEWSAVTKELVTLGVCFLAALTELLLQGGCTLAQLPNLLAQAVALVFTSYVVVWKSLDKLGLLTWLENKGNT